MRLFCKMFTFDQFKQFLLYFRNNFLLRPIYCIESHIKAGSLMDKIYELKDHTKLLLYSHQHFIYTFSLPAKNTASPMSIAADYDSMLESCIFDSTIYYVYRNTSHNIIMANLLFNNPHIIFNDEAQIYSPVIHHLFKLSENLLCAIITVKNPLDQKYLMEIWTIRPEIKRMVLPTAFSVQPHVEITEFKDDLFLYEQGDQIHQVLRIRSQKLVSLFEQSPKEIIDLPDIYQQLAASPLPAIASGAECPGCRRKEEKIMNLTRQYNDLVETAKQIQAEGLQWKKRCQSHKKSSSL